MARILIADDSSVMRRSLNMLLSRAGHTVVGEAANGEQAFLLYGKEHPDIVTMDISMPVMDGNDAITRILTSYPEARIIVISALDEKKMILQALKNGAKQYIIKPVTEEKLLQAIKNVMVDS
ncbi:response regulator [Syntrophomonas palmitatica]|uniref:response regulator n=1 Tax=Syntrophomonas palmitatica TaxID=402877 RepID=UPI0006D18AF0|nr:response regulator [Syntrophomonas palmitatica]